MPRVVYSREGALPTRKELGGLGVRLAGLLCIVVLLLSVCVMFIVAEYYS